jgi:hypothetical protein
VQKVRIGCAKGVKKPLKRREKGVKKVRKKPPIPPSFCAALEPPRDAISSEMKKMMIAAI